MEFAGPSLHLLLDPLAADLVITMAPQSAKCPALPASPAPEARALDLGRAVLLLLPGVLGPAALPVLLETRLPELDLALPLELLTAGTACLEPGFGAYAFR